MKTSDKQNWTRQRGGAKIGTLIWLFMFVAIIIVGREAIPVKMRSSQFEDYMIEQAKFAGGRGAPSLQRALLNKANELEIPVDKKTCRVRKTNGRVKMDAEYTITLTFPFYEYDWHFVHYVDRPVFII